MSNPNLNSLEIKDLINRYKSELRKLDFQVEKTQGTIADLEAQLGERTKYEELEAGTGSGAESSTAAAPTKKRGRGRPRKSEKASSNGHQAKKKSSSAKSSKRRAAAAPVGPKPMKRKRKLSEWDEFVLDALAKSKTTLISSELLEKAERKNKRKSGSNKLSDIQLKRKLNQVLHKLANKRGAIVKTEYEGKGFAYGLPDWYDDKGQLKSAFQR